jgi:preprotein translocase subunit SecG
MTIAALSWPAASIYIAVIIAIALVLAVLIHSIFRTGQAASGTDGHK